MNSNLSTLQKYLSRGGKGTQVSQEKSFKHSSYVLSGLVLEPDQSPVGGSSTGKFGAGLPTSSSPPSLPRPPNHKIVGNLHNSCAEERGLGGRVPSHQVSLAACLPPPRPCMTGRPGRLAEIEVRREAGRPQQRSPSACVLLQLRGSGEGSHGQCKTARETHPPLPHTHTHPRKAALPAPAAARISPKH